MLAVELEQHTAQVLDPVVELIEVVDVLLGGALVGIERIALPGKNMIQHLQNWGEILVHLRQNFLFCQLLLQVKDLLAV